MEVVDEINHYLYLTNVCDIGLKKTMKSLRRLEGESIQRYMKVLTQ